jgi:hypothetical protein
MRQPMRKPEGNVSPEVLAERVNGFEALVDQRFNEVSGRMDKMEKMIEKVGWGVVSSAAGIAGQIIFIIIKAVLKIP